MELGTYLGNQALSEAKFGRSIDVSQAAVNRYVRGDRIPTPRIMARIEAATSGAVTANDFYRAAALRAAATETNPEKEAV
jgi:DNA-binding transcriptional regulator YdaS (Cro superfamily)